jgi:ABC-2 type transport system ATP-binding protein
MADTVIRTERLTKRYGSARGVVDLSFEVLPGEIFGFLGPNGAGKTTTIRLLLDLIRPSSGGVEVFGLDARRRSREIRRRLGYLPGDLRLYDRLTAREHLRYLAGLRGLPGLGDGETLARRFELDLDRPVRALSKGNRQKVGVLLAFFHRPDLLVLDEPTASVDTLVEARLLGILRELNRRMAVVVVSHDLGFVSSLVDVVVCVNRRVAVHPTRELTGEMIRDLYRGEVCMVRHDDTLAVERGADG